MENSYNIIFDHINAMLVSLREFFNTILLSQIFEW